MPQEVILILSPFNTLPENLALEQLLLMKGGNYFILHKNQDCIVLGRNQILFSEINLSELISNNIPVFRRHSGGGAVFLDQGTLNYAFISDYSFEKCSYSYFNNIIIKILIDLGFVDVAEEGCNIFLKNFKISGTAQYKRKNRFMHHGTLLVNTNIKLLETLFSQSSSYKSRAKRSVPAKTEKLLNVNPKLTMRTFEKNLIRALEDKYSKSERTLNVYDLEYIRIRKKEFEGKEWIFGNSPDYEFSNRIILPDEDPVNITLKVRRGRVSDQYFSEHSKLAKINFIGYYHNYEDFFPVISRAFGQIISLADLNSICHQFFNSEKRA